MCSENVILSAGILPGCRKFKLGENKIFFLLSFKMENMLELNSQEIVSNTNPKT